MLNYNTQRPKKNWIMDQTGPDQTVQSTTLETVAAAIFSIGV